MKKFYAVILGILVSMMITGPVPLYSATTGVQIEFLLSQVRNSTGSLAGGKVHFYVAGTSTPKDVYLDINKTPPVAANPYTLDANGTALLYGDGTYRVVIKTAAGVTVYDRDNLKFEDLATDFINAEYTMNLKPKSLTGNDTGNITGYDNITATTRVRAPSIGSASYTDNGYFQSIITKGPWVDVRAYGVVTIGDTVTAEQKTANAASIQAAITNLLSTNGGGITPPGGTVLLPSGILYIDGDIVKLNKNSIKFVGMGMDSTKIYFDSGTAITIDNNTNGCEVSNLAIWGQGTSSKIGIKVINSSRMLLENINMQQITSSGYDSKGLVTQGREMGSFRRLSIYADTPISIENNSYSGNIDADGFHFQDILLGAIGSTKANVFIDNGVYLLNTVFDGYQMWGLGKYGLYWNSTTSTSQSVALTLRNIRWEQASDLTGWFIYMNIPANPYHLDYLKMENLGYSGGNINGIYMRNVNFVDMENINLNSAGAGKYPIDIDNTLTSIQLRNVWQSTAGTWSTGSLYPIYSVHNSSGGVTYTYVFTIYDSLNVTIPRYQSLLTYDNNAQAISGGLVNGSTYKTSTGNLMVVY